MNNLISNIAMKNCRKNLLVLCIFKFDYKVIFLLFTWLVSYNSAYCQSTKLMTYNIRYDNKADGINNWELRKEAMVKLMAYYEPAFIGLQEALYNQLTYLNSELPTYTYVGVGRDDGMQKGEYSAILFDSTQYKVIESNTFWLSETPNKISKGWDAAIKRICTYGLFENINTKKQIWIFNTHFDHIGQLARTNSAQLILDKIKTLVTTDVPIILMGDFNLTPEKEGISIINTYMQDGKEISNKSFYGPEGTANGFDHSRTLNTRIDYIFFKNVKVNEYIHIDDRMENNMHISDHLPVYAIIEY